MNIDPNPNLEWVPGDTFNLLIPAHGEALRAGGEAFLTRAFHASGTLASGNRVARITHMEDLIMGGTGTKQLLSVVYEKPAPGLPTDLFVKFSRNFSDPMRDRPKYMLESEVQFALLTRTPGFPTAVPAYLFGDYHRESGTGVLITERVAYGRGNIEPHYQKCLDYDIPEPLAHYKALIKAIARLAGTQKAGRLSSAFDIKFPVVTIDQALATDVIRYDEQGLHDRIARFADFAARFPHLLPKNLATPGFAARLSKEMPLFLAHQNAVKQYLGNDPVFVALCHWNANIDNAWFWRNAEGELESGLTDWARVGHMHIGQSILGGFSGAELELWDNHLVELLALFAAEFSRCGGPALDIEELRIQLHLVSALTGLAHLMEAPRIIQAQMPEITAVESRFDPRFRTNETPRVQLHMMTMFLNQWETRDFGELLKRILQRKSSGIPTPVKPVA